MLGTLSKCKAVAPMDLAYCTEPANSIFIYTPAFAPGYSRYPSQI